MAVRDFMGTREVVEDAAAPMGATTATTQPSQSCECVQPSISALQCYLAISKPATAQQAFEEEVAGNVKVKMTLTAFVLEGAEETLDALFSQPSQGEKEFSRERKYKRRNSWPVRQIFSHPNALSF